MTQNRGDDALIVCAAALAAGKRNVDMWPIAEHVWYTDYTPSMDAIPPNLQGACRTLIECLARFTVVHRSRRRQLFNAVSSVEAEHVLITTHHLNSILPYQTRQYARDRRNTNGRNMGSTV